MSKFYRFIKATFGWMFKIVYRIKPINLENAPTEAPFIVCANHTHVFDVVPTVIYLKPQIHFMAKKEVFKTPILGPFAKGMGAYSVDRGAGDISAIRKSIDTLKNNGCICVFPQGTRCPYLDPREIGAKEGVGMIAARAGVGILPVCIRTKRNKVSIFRKTEFVVGEFIPPEKLEFPDLHGKDKYKAISDMVYEKICQMNNEIERKPLKEKKAQKYRAKLAKKEAKRRIEKK